MRGEIAGNPAPVESWRQLRGGSSSTITPKPGRAMSLNRRSLLLSAGAAGLAAGAPALVWAGEAAATGDAALTRRFDAITDQMLIDGPEGATSLGLDKGARAALEGRLANRSWAAVKAQAAWCGDTLVKLNAIPDATLSPDARLNKAVVAYALNLTQEAGRFDFGDNTLFSAMGESATPYVVNQQNGNYAVVPEFLDSQHRIDTRSDADAYLLRMRALAVTLDQETERVRRDAGNGVIAPDFILENAIGQMDGLLATPAAQARMVASVVRRTKANGIAGDYGADATHIVSAEIYPALARQRAALKAAAVHATADAGVWKLKDGEAYYAWALKDGTNTAMTANEVHELGLEQNRAIETRMDGLLKKQGLSQGSASERMIALAKDPRFVFADNDAGRTELIAYLNDRIAAVRPRLPQMFNLRLKAPVRVRRVPVDIQDGAGLGYMNTGSLDGSRPSTYYINLKTTSNWPKFSLPTLTFHETIPGHTWQGAYLTETGKLPLIRIMISGFNAYVEGWALYAEQLGDELGMYDDDWAGQLGYLQAQKFRAVRLVVDTGLHAKRWTRDQAVEWAMANSGRTRAAMTSEIDRYCSTPGQACGYKVGHTEINRLRDKARTAMGPRFDIRVFNDLVVKTGAVPLTILGAQVDGYIAGGAA
jgi:uncharacterized protein (DUF885 family)